MSDFNDPRVFFAAERTLLAWNRTGLSVMAFGFVIERFGLFLHLLSPQHVGLLQRSFSYWIGIAFILLGCTASIVSIVQYRKVLRTLKPAETPRDYAVNSGAFVNLAVTALGTTHIIFPCGGQGL